MTDAALAASYRVSRRRTTFRLAVLAVLLLITPVFALTMGSTSVPIREVAGVVASHIPGLPSEVTWSPSTEAIVWQLRVPRILTGLAVGAILGVCGSVMQAIVRNPLAEPYVLGVSSGASTGAAFAILALGASSVTTGIFAFFGAAAAIFAVLLIGGRGGSPLHLILGGLAVGFGFQALTNLIIFSSDSPEANQAVMFWMLGSLARAKWDTVWLVLVVAVAVTVLMVVLGPVLDALASGDVTARAVGVDPDRARLVLLVPVSVAVGVAVAASGGIGFVGLIIPHLMRSVVSYSHTWLILASAMASALFLVWADAASRVIFAPAELPIGVLTGMIGTPFLVVLVRRLKG